MPPLIPTDLPFELAFTPAGTGLGFRIGPLLFSDDDDNLWDSFRVSFYIIIFLVRRINLNIVHTN